MPNAGFKVIEELMAAVADQRGAQALYRGHASDRWLLTPAAFRGPLNTGIKTHRELRRWKQIATRVADRNTTDLEWLVLAQHYGVATTLLDWTTNPLVALYFACASHYDPEQRTIADGCIHMISGEALPTAPTNRTWDPLEEYSGPPLVIDTLTMNRRTLAQDSVMTLHQETTSHPIDNERSLIFRVMGAKKREALEALRIMGISSDRIFSDIGIIAREFTEELAREVAINALRRTAE